MIQSINQKNSPTTSLRHEIYEWSLKAALQTSLELFLYGMENSIPVQIKQFPQSPAEPSDILPLIHLTMATKPNQLIKASSFTLYKYYVLYSVSFYLSIKEYYFSNLSSHSFIVNKWNKLFKKQKNFQQHYTNLHNHDRCKATLIRKIKLYGERGLLLKKN